MHAAAAGTNTDPLLYPNLPFAPSVILTMAKALNDKLVAMVLGGTRTPPAKTKPSTP